MKLVFDRFYFVKLSDFVALWHNLLFFLLPPKH